MQWSAANLQYHRDRNMQELLSRGRFNAGSVKEREIAFNGSAVLEVWGWSIGGKKMILRFIFFADQEIYPRLLGDAVSEELVVDYLRRYDAIAQAAQADPTYREQLGVLLSQPRAPTYLNALLIDGPGTIATQVADHEQRTAEAARASQVHVP